MRRILGSLALVLLFLAMSVLPGCTVNLHSGNTSLINYTSSGNAYLLQDCNTQDVLWMKAYKNTTVMGVPVAAETAYVWFHGWGGDSCSVTLETNQQSYYCSYTRAEANQSGIDVLRLIATRCDYASGTDQICEGSGEGIMGEFLDTNESCTGG
jgi:hypothetical protein